MRTWLKFALGRGLVGAYAASADLCHKVIFRPDRAACKPPQNIDLPYVSQRIGDGALE